MQEKIDQAKQATVGQDENSAFSAVHVYRCLLYTSKSNTTGKKQMTQEVISAVT